MRLAGDTNRVSDLPGDLPYKLQIEFAVLSRRRADAYERHIGRLDGLLVILSSREQAVFCRLSEEAIQLRLDDGRYAAGERLDFFGLHIHAHDGVPHLGETPGSDCADIAKTEN